MSVNSPPGLGFPPELLRLLRELKQDRYLYLTWTPYHAGRPGGPRRGRLDWSPDLVDSAVPALLAGCVGLGFTGWGSLRCVERATAQAKDAAGGAHQGSQTFWLYFDKPDPGEAPPSKGNDEISIPEILQLVATLKAAGMGLGGAAGSPPPNSTGKSDRTNPDTSQAEASDLKWD